MHAPLAAGLFPSVLAAPYGVMTQRVGRVDGSLAFGSDLFEDSVLIRLDRVAQQIARLRRHRHADSVPAAPRCDRHALTSSRPRHAGSRGILVPVIADLGALVER